MARIENKALHIIEQEQLNLLQLIKMESELASRAEVDYNTHINKKAQYEQQMLELNEAFNTLSYKEEFKDKKKKAKNDK